MLYNEAIFLEMYRLLTLSFLWQPISPPPPPSGPSLPLFSLSANNGAMAAGVLFVCSMFMYNMMSGSYNDMHIAQKLSYGWLHNFLMAYGWRLIALYESQGL